MTKDKVLITGANGLLGSYILRYLIQNGIDVRATFRKGSDLTLVNDIKEKVEWFEADMTDYPMMEKAMEGCNRIIHSAAVVSYSKKDRSTMIKINVNGTKNLVDLALANNIDHFIHISSIAAIGRPKTSKLLNEETKWEKSQYNTVYGQSKFLSELEVWRGIGEGLKAVILNPSFIFGPGDLNRSSTQLFKFVLNENRFYTRGYLNFVDVRDVVKAIDKVYNQKTIGERYIISGGYIALKDLFGKLALRWGKKKPSIEVGSFVTGIVWRLESMRTFFFGGKAIITRESALSAMRTYQLDPAKSISELKMEYLSIEDTLDWICPMLASKNT